MTFNSDEFECLRYWADPNKAPNFQYLASDSQPIKVKEDLRDLGVRISSNLSFSIHIQNTITAALLHTALLCINVHKNDGKENSLKVRPQAATIKL